MPRSARIVVPGIAHHVTQRGNRQQAIFFSDSDRENYLDILRAALRKQDTQCLAWCLMDNHLHLILVPESADGLRATVASAHTTYSQHVNRTQGASGHLFQGRFASYPMDDAHLMVALRYVENNPVKAGLCERAEDWRWSSARAHVSGSSDGITDVAALARHVPNWKAMLAEGLEAADRIETSLANGLPLASEAWLQTFAAEFGRSLDRPKRGRPHKHVK